MPITYFYFCALATLLYSIPNNTFLETARFELVLLWNKLSQTTFKQDLNILIPNNSFNNWFDPVPKYFKVVSNHLKGVIQRGKRSSRRGKWGYFKQESRKQ